MTGCGLNCILIYGVIDEGDCAKIKEVKGRLFYRILTIRAYIEDLVK